ncbi:MAG: D-tyrosyl-tRNA(Tyr) deacylase [Gemmatimonadetes bacterium]|uniref:D-aminoacyl-tRNA deacylase n=1 Tax=Candidatus Kutchimonas denitrificans TaxID=3056748 RepID=A0AAE4ZAL0_9BACT|nr:D-tyrosyl-tRNA(Tyr) deacylase [Gemmatimonadota bacterium]NIR75607.1 D-tyrosyl-tRNA(Tyr) deacylase [Candidatus Kutchimonas denitrificans]NIS01921.1 D-tyrosyl-tRNA(Tyr) deacylase [Gemmatimonadota bacterium]NIT67702.1 D-tyrosyl-tRNA(Tyr) deacylase [Gemmatimonadota bacterium]NIU53576.1 D-tyrosyl-tRNA(Tyr) deacylase [Gemmatimonadota bacterium]
MRVVLQRVSRAEVRIDGEPVGSIGRGFLLLVAFTDGDGEDQVRWMAEKVSGLRLFPDAEGKMNRTLDEVGGELLVVSQFTLYGDVRKGRRPSFVAAADPVAAERLYDRFVEILRGGTVPVATGSFGAMMEVDLVNDGPVTLIIDRE